MSIHYPDILAWKSRPYSLTYGEKDVILYALSIGMGRDPMNDGELKFVSGMEPKTVPTAVTVLAEAGPGPQWGPTVKQRAGLRQSQLNRLLVVHGAQKVELHKPLPSRGTFSAQCETTGAFDKGEGKGAVIVRRTIWTDDQGEKAATLTTTVFARGDGGFGGPREGEPMPHSIPSRLPDLSLDFATRPDQALLYRLNGDRNPLHWDPEFAKRAGFGRPILHGLCSYGITCHAVLQGMTDYDPERILSHEARFSAPVIPGDTVTVDMWRDEAAISFTARVRERGAIVIRHGRTILRP